MSEVLSRYVVGHGLAPDDHGRRRLAGSAWAVSVGSLVSRGCTTLPSCTRWRFLR